MIRCISDKQATNESVICRAESATETASTEKSLYASMCTLTWGIHCQWKLFKMKCTCSCKDLWADFLQGKLDLFNLLSTLYYMSLLFIYKTVVGGRLHSTAQQGWSSPCFQNCLVVCKSWMYNSFLVLNHMKRNICLLLNRTDFIQSM